MAIIKPPPPRKINVPGKPVATVAKPKPTGVQVPARRPGAPPVAPSNYSAADGFGVARGINAQRDREAAQRKERGFEFNMKIGEGGEKGVTIILTDKVRLPNQMPFFHYAHRWGFERNDPKTEVCIQDDPSGCPLCRSLNKKGTYEMVLTCIDTRPYTPQKGPNAGKTVRRSRKPYVVKTGMIPQFERLYKQHKTFRGMVLTLFRDGQKSPGSGSQVQFVRMLTEAELAKYGPELSTPIDYKKAYPRLTADQMASQYNLDSADGAIGSADVGSGDDDIPF